TYLAPLMLLQTVEDLLMRCSTWLLLGTLLAGCLDDSTVDDTTQGLSDTDTVPQGHGGGIWNKFAGNAKPTGGGHTVPIGYHGGPVMTAATKVYYIWYGDWSQRS